MEYSSTGARAEGVGAVARGDGPKRRRGLWLWLVAGLVLLAIIAAILIAALSGKSHHTKHALRSTPAPATAATSPSAVTPAPAASATTPAATPAPATSTTTPAATPSTSAAAATPSKSSAIAQVGGGGVHARTATGRLAPTGSVGTVLFAEDGVALDTYARQVITTAAKEVRANHSQAITVVGYTDTIGNTKANRTLSLERARAVATALRAQLNSSTAKISVVARGETHPVASNKTADGRQLDRRVAIFAKAQRS